MTHPDSRAKFHLRLTALAAAVAAVGLAAGAASAQYRVPQNGDRLDANNRIGSGGSNGPTGQNVNDQYRARNGNAVVTGNVTGGAAFSGYVPYLAPGQFNDFTPGSGISNFQSVSSGVSASGNQVYNNAGTVRPYYNAATTITAPSGYTQQPYAGGYQPPTTPAGGNAIDYRAGNGIVGGANTLDARINNDLSNAAGGGLSGVNGDVGGNGGQQPQGPLSLIAPGGRVAGNSERPISPYTSLSRDGRYALGADQVGRLREELLRDGDGRRLSSDRISSLLSRNTNQTGDQSQDRSLAAARRVDGRVDDGSARLNARVGPDGQVTPAAQDAGDDVRLAGPADQSRQYAQLRDRLDRFNRDPYAEALRPFRRDEPAAGAEAGEDAGLPGLPSLKVPPPDSPQQPDEGGPADPPVAVRSLAAGVSSPTLKQVYEQAETLLADGQFTDAIARYDVAERLVPNQPLTLVGRATAELGAGYYRRAAVSLRRAFENNRELTMARLDLPKLLGTDRVEQVTESLRQRATNNRQDAEPTFLLGFIAYNTGNFEQAAAFLDLAQRRSGDSFYNTLKTMWGLGEPKPDVAKPDAAPQPDAAMPGVPEVGQADANQGPAAGVVLPATRPTPQAAPPATMPSDADLQK